MDQTKTQPGIIAQWAITLDDRGQLAITGPIDNVMLTYGALETARDIVHDRSRDADKKIILAPAGLAEMMKPLS